MPDRSTQRELDKFGALLDMIVEDGSSPAGQLPPADLVDALRELDDVDRKRIEEIRSAHAQGRAPPDRGGGSA